MRRSSVPQLSGTRRRASEHRDGAFESGAFRGDRACVVPRIGLLLVRRVVFLVDADDPEPRHRCEDGGACADDDRRLAARDACALVATFCLAQGGVKNGDALTEACAKASERLRRQRDLGHEDDGAAVALQCGGARLEVDLGLPAARGAVEEEVRRFACVERSGDALERGLLGRAQLGGLRLSGQCVPLGRLRPRSSCLPLHRCNERQCATGSRAVVVGDPERELDERPRQLLDDTLDRRRVDSLWRLHVDLGHDAALLRVAETHLDDGTGTDVVRNLVRELAREGAGGHERIDRGVTGHPATLRPGCDAKPLRRRG